ncbi:hypothetical protein PHYSODRAFT_509127, partial [Phytophthora sojae]
TPAAFFYAAVFNVYDEDGSGCIPTEHIPEILDKLGRDASEELLNELDDCAGESGVISFEDFVSLIQNHVLRQQEQEQELAGGGTGVGGDRLRPGPDPKVMEFIAILEEYRLKCEEDGNYLEAQRADSQLTALRRQEFKRQSKSLKARQIAERQDVQIAHNMQFNDFNQAWDQYMEEYDRMAQAYVKQMTEKHGADLAAFQDKLQQEILERPPKFSKELIEWRRRQHRLAQQKSYAEAQKIKQIADEVEADERAKMSEELRAVFARKEAKLRQQQQAELAALLKRIDGRRKEHLKQRNLDSKRLLQRNRNVQSVLESKQVAEATKKIQDIKMSLMPKERAPARGPFNVIPPQARRYSLNRMDIGRVLLRDAHYVWRERVALLEKDAVVLQGPPSAWQAAAAAMGGRPKKTKPKLKQKPKPKLARQRSKPKAPPPAETLPLDGSLSCEGIVVSSAHMHSVRLQDLRSGREFLVDATTRGKRQMWIDLFASARNRANISSSWRGDLSLMDVEEGGDAVGATTRSLTLLDMQQAVEMLVAATESDADTAVVRGYDLEDEDRPSRERCRGHLLWLQDSAFQHLLAQFDREEDGVSGTDGVQALLRFGAYSVPTALALANELLHHQLIVECFASRDENGAAFQMNTSARYKKVCVEPADHELRSDDGDEKRRAIVSSERVARLKEERRRLQDQIEKLKGRYFRLFNLFCFCCVLVLLDALVTTVLLPGPLKLSLVTGLLLWLTLSGGTATLSINFQPRSHADELNGTSQVRIERESKAPDLPQSHLAPQDTLDVASRIVSTLPMNTSTNRRGSAAVATMQHESMDRAVIVLTQAEEAEVHSFRLAIAQAAGVPVEVTHVFSDEYLFRVLRVKNRAFAYAVTKMAHIVEWRRVYEVDTIAWDDVKSQLVSGSMYWYGYDFQNRPILWVRAKLKDWDTMASRRDVEVRAHVYLLELGCRRFMPPGVTTYTVVTDSAGLGMKQVDLRLMRGLLDVCVANFPDRIGLVYAGPLTRFLKYITSWLWPFLPVRLRSKVSLMHDCAAELAKHMDTELIPLHMGGSAMHNLRTPPTNPAEANDIMEITYMIDQQKRFMEELKLKQ